MRIKSPACLWISTRYAPFVVEVGEAVRSLGLDVRLLFTSGRTRPRPKHWDAEPVPEWVYLQDPGTRPGTVRRIRSLLDEFRPGVVIVSKPGAWHTHVAIREAKRRGMKSALWQEQPMPRSLPRSLVRDFLYRMFLKKVDYVVGVGYRSVRYFQRVAGERCQYFCIPYGQDLSANYEFRREYSTDGPVRFLFSGRLETRNNILETLYAVKHAAVAHEGRVRLVMSAYAGREEQIRRLIDADPVLSKIVTHDTDFETWEDRLRPFKNSDVLLYPGLHSGWALVVPEAMSLGMPVISSPGVEAARFLVRDGIEGFLIEPTYTNIETSIERFVENPGLIGQMGMRARERSRQVDAPTVGQRFYDCFTPACEAYARGSGNP
jgi:glycosyltransferase involved in cell wall biosynthesis